MRALLASAVVLAAWPAVAQTSGHGKPERVICKRTQRTGSLVATNKECHTAREWELMAQSARNTAQYEMDRQRTRQLGE